MGLAWVNIAKRRSDGVFRMVTSNCDTIAVLLEKNVSSKGSRVFVRTIFQESSMSKIAARWRQREQEGLSRRERSAGQDQEKGKRDVPTYPSTPEAERVLLGSGTVWIAEEKLDGANCAVWLDDGRVRIRDRSRALRKGVMEGGWGKKQFAPLWERAERSKKSIMALENALGFSVALYGEWLLIVHGQAYEAVVDPWRPWGIWATERRAFVDPVKARYELEKAGFAPPVLVGKWSEMDGWPAAMALAVGESELGGAREGVVFKTGDGEWQTGVCKIVRSGFKQGALWSSESPVFQSKSKK